MYLPHGLDWIKSRAYVQLKKVAKKIEATEDDQTPNWLIYHNFPTLLHTNLS